MYKIADVIAMSNEYTSKILGQDVHLHPLFRLKRKHCMYVCNTFKGALNNSAACLSDTSRQVQPHNVKRHDVALIIKGDHSMVRVTLEKTEENAEQGQTASGKHPLWLN